MIQGIIFDFDGTLFDSMFIWETAGEVYLRSIGKEPEAELRQIIKSMSLFQSAEYIREKYHVPLSSQDIMEGVNRTVEDFYLYTVKPKPGVIALLEELYRRNIKMCIATATDRYQVEAALKRCDMQNFFSEIFTCTEVGRSKESPEIFRKAMDYMQTDCSTTAVIEDAYYAACAAKMDGFNVIGVYDPYESRETELIQLVDIYLPDYFNLTNFWKLVSAK